MITVNESMLQLNKHFMEHHGMVVIPPVPQEVTPITLTALPMADSASWSTTVECDSHRALIRIWFTVGDVQECWTREPERRTLSRRIATAEGLRDAAKIYSVESFQRYITDCGFKVQA